MHYFIRCISLYFINEKYKKQKKNKLKNVANGNYDVNFR